MANKFEITISAIDKATATIQKINASMARITAPMDRLQKSMGNLGREAGLVRFGHKLKQVGVHARDVAGNIRAIAAPMAAVVGVGSIAGITELATQWGRAGWEISRTAQTIGISTSKLQSLRGAAQLAGLSAGDMTAGLKSLGDTMEDALYGRNQQALVMLNRLGIRVHHTADGAIDAARGFTDLSAAIARIHNPQVQGLVARAFGLESLLPLLRQGPQAIAAYEAKVKSLGGVQGGAALESAKRFSEQMQAMHIAISGLKISIGSQLLPVLQPLIEQLTRWITQNRQLIGQKVADFVRGVAQALQRIDWDAAGRGIRDFISGIQTLVGWLGGWKNAAIAVGAVMAGPLLLSVTKIGLAITDIAISAIPLMIRGLSLLSVALWGIARNPVVAAILTGGAIGAGIGKLLNGLINLSTKKLTGGKSDSLGGWLYDATHPQASESNQIPIGIRNNNPGNLRQWGNLPTVGGFARFPTAQSGIDAIAKNLSRYGIKGINTLSGIVHRWAPSSDGNNEAAYVSDLARQTGFGANQHLNLNQAATLAPLISAMIRHENGKNPYNPAMIQAAAQKVEVEVAFKNAPHGTTAKAKADGHVKVHPPRVGHGMPEVPA